MSRLIAIIGLLVIALGAGIGLGLYQNHQQQFEQVSVTLPAGVTARIYPDLGGDGSYNYDPQSKPVATLSGSRPVQLKNGVYDLVIADPAHHYTQTVFRQTVDYMTISIAPRLAYTDGYLTNTLPQLRSQIDANLFSQESALQPNYHIGNDKLYLLGDWYGAVLQPNDANLDTLRVILHKSGSGQWQVAAQPDLSIGEPSHQNIPVSVIESVDTL